MPKINRDSLAEIKLLVPPVKEQKKITDYVQIKLNEIDQLVSKVNDVISLLQERRTALNSAAVTGKIDVRNAPSARSVSQSSIKI